MAQEHTQEIRIQEVESVIVNLCTDNVSMEAIVELDDIWKSYDETECSI